MTLLLTITALVSVASGVSAQCMSLADAAMAAGLTTLVDAIGGVAEVDVAEPLVTLVVANETLATPITVFAPTNEAFEDIEVMLGSLDLELVLAVLLNHILPSEESSEALVATAPDTLPTLLGTELDTSIVGTDLIVSSGPINSTVVITDVVTCAGIVHVIDAVLVPSLADAPVGVSAEASETVSTTDVRAAAPVGAYGSV